MKADPVAVSRRMILVLGMHRSGTSAVAGTLSHLGVDFSEHLIAATEDNPKGYFEHADIWQQDHEILQALGSQWDDPLPLPDGWQNFDIVDQVYPQIQSILKRDFAAAELAGVKDPRMCRLMPLWREWLVREGFSPRIVLVIRRPSEVIASLAKRDQLPADQAAWVWLRHVLEVEAATRGLPRVALRYEKLLQDWRTETARMVRALEVELPFDQDSGSRIDAFLEPTLRHYRDETRSDVLAEPLHGWLERTYAALTTRDTPDLDALDRVAMEIGHADRVGMASANLLRGTRQRNLRLESDWTWCDTERLALSAGNVELRENLKWCDTERLELSAGNALLQENLDRHVLELEQMRQGNDYLKSEIERYATRVAELTTEFTHVADVREKLAAELAAVYASRSWRITRPMRGALRFGRRLLGRRATDSATSLARVEPASPFIVEPVVDPAAVVAAAFAAATGPRILIVTPDILGPIRNGGIGTAFGGMARTLAHAGHAVTILYTLGGHSEDGGDIARWERHYAMFGVRFLPIWLERGEPVLDAPHHAWRAYRVYLWLKQHQLDYDLAYFPEWKGEAYYALQAKRLGLDFEALRMLVVTHSSTTWAESGNYIVPQKFDDLLLEFLERRSTEMADAVISPSQYMVDWMKGRGWRWTSPTHVIQNLMPDAQPEPAFLGAPLFTVTEWVFFGRLERRKGLLIFLDALRLVPAELRQRIQITFLGKSIRTPEFDSEAVIREKLADWPRPFKIIADHDRDQALHYLQQPGRIAVIASLVENSPYTVLECVLKRIPFVAADVGGIAELIHPDDAARALFSPTPAGLARILTALDGGRYAPPRPATSAATTRQQWLDLQDQLLREIPAETAPSLTPLPHITVCLVHYNRPALLAQAIDSLRQQSYDRFDVVLVDDGSPSAHAQAYLDSLHDEFTWRGWSIVRQANAYLGAARNTAVRHARGEYVLFMDDDNIAKPDELAVFARAARHSDADILTTVSDVFTDTGSASCPPEASRQLWIPLGNAQGLGVFRNVFGDANALVRRLTFEALGGFTEDYGVGHEDWEFFARASLAGANLQLVPESLFWYRLGATSMLRAGSAQADHARSLRPYWEGLHGGVGATLAYASHLHRNCAASPMESAPVMPSAGRRRWSMLVLGVFQPHVRARFMQHLRTGGWRGAIKRVFCYIGLSRSGRP